MNEKIYQVVANTIAEVREISVSDVAPGKTMKDMDIDSLDMLDIITSLEDHYGITVPDEAFEGVETVEDAVNCLDKLVG